MTAGWLERELEEASADVTEWPEWLRPADERENGTEEESPADDPFESE